MSQISHSDNQFAIELNFDPLIAKRLIKAAKQSNRLPLRSVLSDGYFLSSDDENKSEELTNTPFQFTSRTLRPPRAYSSLACWGLPRGDSLAFAAAQYSWSFHCLLVNF